MFFFKTRKKKHSDECIFKTEKKKKIVTSKTEGAHFQNSNKMTPHFELVSGKCL